MSDTMEKNNIGKYLFELNMILDSHLESFDFKKKHKKNSINTQIKLLFILDTYGRQTTNQLVKKLLIAKSNLSNLCKDMLCNNLIKKFPCEKVSNIVCYEITDVGKIMLDEVLEQVLCNVNNLFNKKNKTCVENALNKIISTLNK